jgi:hypothetical protein
VQASANSGATTGPAAVTGVLSQVTANNNNDGILVVGGPPTGALLNVTIADSVASKNRNQGVGADSITATRQPPLWCAIPLPATTVPDLRCRVAILRVAHSLVTGNNIGVNNFGATLFSYGDNDIAGNANNKTGVQTAIPTHRRRRGASPALRPARPAPAEMARV